MHCPVLLNGTVSANVGPDDGDSGATGFLVASLHETATNASTASAAPYLHFRNLDIQLLHYLETRSAHPPMELLR
jgi:hypothetical protein